MNSSECYFISSLNKYSLNAFYMPEKLPRYFILLAYLNIRYSHLCVAKDWGGGQWLTPAIPTLRRWNQRGSRGHPGYRVKAWRMGWRHDPAVKSTYYSPRGIKFDSQHPRWTVHSLPVTPAPGRLTPLGSRGTCIHVHVPMHRHVGMIFNDRQVFNISF